MATIQEERAARTPEERRDLFCLEYVKNGGRLYNAAVSAGFPAASASVRASELMKRSDVQERISELLRERFVVEGTKAHAVVLELSKKSSPKDAVKLRAAQQLMELGGLFKRSDKAAHDRDAEKRTNAETARMCQDVAAGWLAMLCCDSPATGRETGIKFVDGTFTIVNAEDATARLNKMWEGWTVTIPAKFAAGQTPNLYYRGNYEPEDEPEEEENWVAA